MSKRLPRFAVALTRLRTALGWSQGELAAALGISSNLISDYERGHKPLGRERLDQLAATLGLPRDAVDDVLAWVDKVWGKAGTAVYPAEPAEAQAERRRLEAVVQALARATSEVGRPLFTLLSVEMRALAERQGVKGSWARLQRRPPAERRALVRKSRELRSWALCELACAESLKAAPHSAELALEHAGLAVEIARLAICADLFRWLEGRVATGLGRRDEAIAILKHVSREFARRNISHDAALASMEVDALTGFTDRRPIP